MIILNIGLAGNDESAITTSQALAAVYATGARIVDYNVRPSSSEQTLIAELDRALSPEEAHGVASVLHQDCIAQLIVEYDRPYGPGAKLLYNHGELYGPRADAWRPFDPAFFLTLD